MKSIFVVTSLTLALISACPDKDPYCSFCNGPVCIFCVASFPNNRGRCAPPTVPIENCIAYKSDRICRSCKLGFALSNNRCVRIPITDCLEAVEGSCSFCDKGILQVNGQCASRSTCADANCSLCKRADGGTEICGLCKPGYALQVLDQWTYRCIRESGGNANCLRVFNEDASKCAVCDLNYFWRNAGCQKSSAYQIDYLLQAASKSWWKVW